MSKKDEARALYNAAFGVSEGFDDALFDGCFDYCHTLLVGNKVVSMLFALPCEIVFEDKRVPARYIYAAATDIDYRGKGLMGKLLERVKNEGEALILRPAEPSLIGFYEKYGFKGFKAVADKNNLPYVAVDAYIDNMAEGGEIDSSEFTMMCYGIDQKAIDGLSFAYSMQ